MLLESIMNTLSLAIKILLGLVAAVVVTVGVIVATVDPNDYREEITQLVKDETGRDFQVQTMSLSIFPRLGLNLENASLSNAENFQGDYFVKVDKVQVGAALLPLLSKTLEVDTLTLHGLSLNLERKKDGTSNWDDLAKTDKNADIKDDEPAQSNSLDKLASLNIGGIDIQDGQVHWSDALNQQDIQLQNLNFSSGAIEFGEFFEMDLSAATKISKPEIMNKLSISIEAKLDNDGQYALRNLRLDNELSGAGIPVEQAQLTVELPSFALENQQLSLPELMIEYAIKGGKEFPLSQVDGQLTLNDLQGDIDKQTFNAKKIQINSKVSGDNIPNGSANISLDTSAQIDLTKQTASLPKFNAQLLALTMTGKVDLNQLKTDPVIAAQLNMNETNLRTLLKQLKVVLPEMADNKTLTKFASSMAIKYTTKSQALKVSNLKLTLDDSQLTGSASVSQFSAPNIAYNLELNSIDINRYLPPKKEQPETPKNAADTKIELPVELLRKLSINGTLKVGKASIDKINASNIVMTTKGAKGLIKVNPLKANLFKTRLNATAALDVRGKKPKYSFTTNTKNLPIGEVLMAFTDSDKISGTGALNANISTSGDHISSFKNNLSGVANLDLKDGAIKGFNLAQAIRNAKAKMSGKPTEPTDENAQTDFSSLVAQVTIKNGVVTTKKLAALAPYMRINGSGTVNLPKETLNYLVKTKIVGSDKGQGGKELQELNGLTIPVKLTGAMTSPKVSLDLNSLLEQKATQEIEKKKEEVVKGVEEKLKESIFKGFKF